MKILLKNATIINEKSEFHNETLDILIENGIVSQIKKDIDIDADSIINKKDLHVSSLELDLLPLLHHQSKYNLGFQEK